jgi:hypothetical protein
MPPFGKTKEQILAEMFPGKTEEQIKEMVSSFDTLKAKADKVDGLETNLATMTNDLTTTRTKLQELEAGRNNQNQNQNQNQSQNQNTKPDWGEDADAAFNDRSRPLVNLTLDTRAEVIYDRVVRRLETDDPYFSKFRKEFDELLKQEKNPANRASEAYVENCYNVVYARHRNEILRDVRAGSGDFFIETGRGQGGNQDLSGGNRIDTSKTLTDEEKKEAAKFGVSPEKWLETRNKIKFVGGAIQQM